MKSLGSTGSFIWTPVLVLLAFVCVGNGFKQELWLYDAQDNALQFHSHVSNMSDYNLLLSKVTRVCTRGAWVLFSKENFVTVKTDLGLLNDARILCYVFTPLPAVKSLRHLGASDTDTDALSLYEGSYNSEKEIYVTSPARTGIKTQITSIAITGKSDWMLFEGTNLDGKSICYKVPSGYNVYHNFVSYLKLTTIRSVFKGCDVREILNYKMLQAS